MGHRLSRIYTRTGDDGSTGLGDGQRVAKDDARVASFGTVDEANAALGLLLAAPCRGCTRAGGASAAPAVRSGRRAVHSRPRRDPCRRRLGPGAAAGPLQRQPPDAEGIHPAGRRRSCRALPSGPHHRPPRRARDGHPGPPRGRPQRGAAIPQPAVGPAVRAGRVLARADGHGEALWQPQQRQR